MKWQKSECFCCQVIKKQRNNIITSVNPIKFCLYSMDSQHRSPPHCLFTTSHLFLSVKKPEAYSQCWGGKDAAGHRFQCELFSYQSATEETTWEWNVPQVVQPSPSDWMLLCRQIPPHILVAMLPRISKSWTLTHVKIHQHQETSQHANPFTSESAGKKNNLYVRSVGLT